MNNELDKRFDDLYRYLDMRFDQIERRLTALEKEIDNHGEWLSRYAVIKPQAKQ